MKQLAVFAILVGGLSNAFGLDPWEPLGPPGVSVAAMSVVPGYPGDLYLVAEGYPAPVFYTHNSGATWEARDTIYDKLYALAVDPGDVQTLYAGGMTGKVYRSTDAGSAWSVRGTLPAGAVVCALLVHPQNGLRLFAAADVPGGIGCYRSTDGGATWSQDLSHPGFEARAFALACDDTDPDRLVFGGTAGNRPVLYRTEAAGDSWIDVSDGLGGRTAYGAALSPAHSTDLLCATDSGIYLSTDLGENWTRRRAVPAYSVIFAPASPHYAYAGSDNLVYRSDDDGFSWDAETTAFAGTLTRWLGINPSSGLEVYAGSGVGVFHTLNGGFSWTGITGDFNAVTVPFIYHHPLSADTVYAVPPGYAVLASPDLGRTWARVFDSLPNAGLVTGLAINPAEPDTAVLVTSYDSYLHLTIDRGDSWEKHEITDYFAARGVAYHPADPDTLFAWGGRRDSLGGPTKFAVYKSDSAGVDWDYILRRGSDGLCLGFAASGTGETLYAWGEVDGGPALYRSIDRGVSWETKVTGIAGAPVRDFARSPADPDVFYCATPDGVFQSMNHLGSWLDIGLEDVTAVLPDTASRNSVAAGTDTAAIQYTPNGGAYWDPDTLGLVTRSILFLARHRDNAAGVYCGTEGSGLYHRGVIAVAEPAPPPERGGRFSASPSLVRDRAVLSLAPMLGQRTGVDLYHTDGRLAARIAAFESAPPSCAWQRPDGLAAGVYLILARTADDTHVTKVVLTAR